MINSHKLQSLQAPDKHIHNVTGLNMFAGSKNVFSPGTVVDKNKL